MKFSKGNRFPLLKDPGIPGPNAYDVNDPEYDAYKKGAILEQADRFTKEKPSDVPGPGTYNTENKAVAAKSQNAVKPASGDRFVILQRKVEDLERIHAESKKTHLAEIERLKLELSRSQKSNTDHTERIDKLKKQNDALDVRVQELKKINATDQIEIKDLRVKLRMAEHERTQLASKQGEASDTKKALQALDAKRREELRERDKKIADLEKALSGEKKKREAFDAKLADVKEKMETEAQAARAAASTLEAELRESQAQAKEAKSSYAYLQAKASDTEEELLAQLEQHRQTLSRVAEEYGRLACSTVPTLKHDRLKHESTSLQLRVLRLERKLANSEAQVIELANLIRYTKENNAFLSSRLRDAEEEARSLVTQRQDDMGPGAYLSDSSLHESLREDVQALRDFELDVQKADTSSARVWADFYRLRHHQLLFHSSGLIKGLDDAQHQLQSQAAQLIAVEAARDKLSTELSAARSEHGSTQGQLAITTASLTEARSSQELLRTQLEDAQSQMKKELASMEQKLAQEKEASKRLAGTVHKSKMAEDALRAEVEQLMSDLADAERFQDAYNGLVEEVGALVDRQALAEDEAQRLSKFNAEILGHNNPAQRIMYVDRIRRELHETKQKLLVMTRERDTIATQNEDLQHELDIYVSVAVPPENKPRTTVTRVSRVPLATQNVNVDAPPHSKSTGLTVAASGARKLNWSPDLEYKEGDMTVDEIM